MDINTKHITANSKEVENGSIFVAIKGYSVDGHNFIEEAVHKGAKTIVLEDRTKIIPKFKNKINFVLVSDSRIALAELASKLYRQPDNIVAVTGTNGKTSVVNFINQILTRLGKHSASIGTLGIRDDRKIFDNKKEYQNLTTPETVTLHKALEELKDHNINYTAIEASSHGLVQHRLDGLQIKAAAFTNLSQDHLDFHKSMENYFKAKTLLFSRLLPTKASAVLNADIKEYEQLKEVCLDKKQYILSYGKKGEFLTMMDSNYQQGLDCEYILADSKYTLKTDLLGEFQLYNIFTAACLVYALGFSSEQIAKVLNNLEAIPGRMQRIAKSEVFVDYAHTPDALQKTLMVMRQNLEGKLIVVFGCGGDRDIGKRPLMGKIASQYADLVIVTDDNPRTESPSKIRQEILVACNKDAVEIDGREKAIKYAIENMGAKDRLLIAGKGHEDYQIIGTEKTDFSDSLIAANIIAKF